MIKVIIGPPGTGKTTRLLRIVDEAIKNGTRPDKIGFISFTKKAVNEARDRAVDIFKLEKEDLVYYRTIHSLAFRQLSMNSKSVMQWRNYKEIGELLGVRITGNVKADKMLYELQKGDQMVFIESLARLMQVPLKQLWENSKSDIDWFELDQYERTLIKYKKVHCLVDFTDMLTKYKHEGFVPDLDILLVDEAQDLCRLQWDIVERLISKSKNVYIAGDDDQAIFRWSGADVDYFIDFKSDTVEVLDQSYRLPKQILSASDNLIKTVKKRRVKQYRPTEKEGCLDFVQSIEDENMDTGEWLVLVRNSYMMRDISDYLRYCGYRFETPYENPGESDQLKAAFAWERLRKGGTINTPELKLICDSMSKNNFKNKYKVKHVENMQLNMSELRELFSVTTDDIWHKSLDNIHPDDREYYIALLRRGEKLHGPSRIKVNTIHGAKGGECENVLLYTDVSSKTYSNIVENNDDETRVFYVGMTRTLNKLSIVQPQSRNYFSI